MLTKTYLSSQSESLPKPEVIFFDWDNTLVDTLNLITNALNGTFQAFGKPLWNIESVKDKLFLSARDAFPLWFGEEYPQALEVFYDYVNKNHLNQVKPLAMAEDLLKIIIHKNIPMVIVSNKRGDILRKEVEHLDWNKYFTLVLGSGDSLADKPSPQPVYLARQKLFLSNENNWFIGDTIADFKCAVASQCLPIRVGPEPTELQSDYFKIFASCMQLKELVENIA